MSVVTFVSSDWFLNQHLSLYILIDVWAHITKFVTNKEVTQFDINMRTKIIFTVFLLMFLKWMYQEYYLAFCYNCIEFFKIWFFMFLISYSLRQNASRQHNVFLLLCYLWWFSAKSENIFKRLWDPAW